MPIYNIEIPQSVKDKIEEQALYIALDKPSVALKWYDTIYNKIESLSTSPNRCSEAPESQYVDFKIYHLLIGNYRVLFYIEGQTVIILDFKSGWQNKPEQ
ncbi:MAG: type II toxin-antitoxin system RelE/ParE family toxin [Pseudomonadales bacterium]